jgi:hypothetical protein
MPITEDQLLDNYYFACVVYLCPDAVYVANDPSTGKPWAFTLKDDGLGPHHPQPYIATWDIKSPTQPTDDYLTANTSMAQINACHDALYPPPALDKKAALMNAAEIADLRSEMAKLKADAAQRMDALAQENAALAKKLADLDAEIVVVEGPR